jgi:hypothetical protein
MAPAARPASQMGRPSGPIFLRRRTRVTFALSHAREQDLVNKPVSTDGAVARSNLGVQPGGWGWSFFTTAPGLPHVTRWNPSARINGYRSFVVRGLDAEIRTSLALSPRSMAPILPRPPTQDPRGRGLIH